MKNLTIDKLTEFRNLIAEITGSENVRLTVTARNGYDVFSREQGRSIKSALERSSVGYDEFITNDNACINVKLQNGDTVFFWISNRKSKEEQLAELEEQANRLRREIEESWQE